MKLTRIKRILDSMTYKEMLCRLMLALTIGVIVMMGFLHFVNKSIKKEMKVDETETVL